MLFPIALGMPSGAEWLIIAAIGLLLFGKRLPEVGRSLGKGIVEFKKGLKGVEEEAEASANAQTATPAATTPQLTQSQPQAQPQLTAQTAPAQTPATQTQFKFDPYTGKPIEQPASTNSSSNPQT